MAELPPRTLPLGMLYVLFPADGWGVDCTHQSYSGRPMSLGYNDGVEICLSSIRFWPASITPTFTEGFSVRRAAITRPAVPPPMTT